MTEANTENMPKLLAKGGGDATAAGVRFQASLGALIASELVATRPHDARLSLGDAKPLWIKFETEAPVDDILVATNVGGFVAVQAKVSLQLSIKLDSEFAKTIGQLVRHYLACRMGDGGREWDRPLDQERDRFLIAVGPKSSATIRQYLAEGLNARRQPGTGTIRPLSKLHVNALAAFDSCLRAAWTSHTSDPLTDAIIADLSKLTVVITFDFDGADWLSASAVLGSALGEAAEGERVLNLLVGICQDLMATRSGVDEPSLRRRLAQAGAKLQAPESYRGDVAALLAYSDRVQEALRRYEEIETESGTMVNVPRTCQGLVRDAALEGSLLLIGEPGAGKSAVINAASRDLRELGYDVLELAVDRLPVESLEGLGRELGLKHPLLEVLGRWDGDLPGYVIIDALDATRGGVSEAVFRSLISELISVRGRWRVVASIRTFDLRLGQQLRSLFKGKPPQTSLADSSFSDVRHIKVPTWTNEELQTLLSKAPALAQALAHAPARLQELAIVPFNTRLLAELVNSGIKSDEIATVDSQAELLHLYWSHRVVALGIAAEVRLKRVVELMVLARALRAPCLESAEGNPEALQELIRQGVLTTSANGRYISFRHHLLFDYAASRVYLDPDRLVEGTIVFPKEVGLGLMLGPALSFVLRELWLSNGAHRRFWDAAIRMLGDDNCDPIMRSVVARIASELPIEPNDAIYCADQVLEHIPGAEIAVGHLVGALAVRLEDNVNAALAPWSAFAARLAIKVNVVAWPLRALSYLLTERVKESTDRANLGVTARALLEFGLSLDQSNGLVDAAITFVADTYDTDPACSRSLLLHVFDEERFAKFGPEEVPDLARKIDVIAPVDPDFAVEVYKQIYGRSVKDNRDIPIGSSQILRLTSNAVQDFGMARYSLEEFFPKFLSSHPEHATNALVDAVEGYIAREHALQETVEEQKFVVGGQEARLIDDYSYIWASNPDDQYRQDAEVLISAFRDHLLSASSDIAIHTAECITRRNRTAVLWSRLFMAAAQRPKVLGELIFPYASSEPFLVSLDTQKDAIDLIAAMYPTEPEFKRRAFEKAAHFFNFSNFTNPGKARDGLLKRLFVTIGVEHLVTKEAKDFVPENVESVGRNNRLFNFKIEKGSREPYWWLRDADVDLEAPANATLCAAVDSAKAQLGAEKDVPPNQPSLLAAMDVLRSLQTAITVAGTAEAAQELRRYAEGILAERVAKVVNYKALKALEHRDLAFELAELVLRSAQSASPEVHENTESNFEQSASWGGPAPRVEAAHAALDLCLVDVALYDYLRSVIERLISDPHPAVRLAAATRLVRLWDTDRPGMWQLAERVIREDQNLGVLDHFASSFLGTTLHHDPARVEALTLQLFQRVAGEERPIAKQLIQHLGSIFALLWVSYAREDAGNLLQGWINEPVKNEELLKQTLFAIRDGLVLGYEDDEAGEEDARHRSISLFAQLTEAAALLLEVLLAKPQLDENEQAEAKACVNLLDKAAAQLFFASKSFKTNNDDNRDLPSSYAQLKYLDEVESTVRRIGDVAPPHTIHYLLQMLETLISADPSRVFELSAHALLKGGRKHGYQYESLGANLLVLMVGRCLADHREIFEATERRKLLIECLETFLAAGWPTARRLLYQLPELLQ